MEAVSACNSFGMQLAKFDSEAEQTYLISILRKNHNDINDFWLAGNDIVDEGIWKWAPDDIPVNIKLNWGPDEPNNGSTNADEEPENCLIVSGKYIPLNDVPCNRDTYFICERVHEQ